jgi:hypothetical protein
MCTSEVLAGVACGRCAVGPAGGARPSSAQPTNQHKAAATSRARQVAHKYAIMQSAHLMHPAAPAECWCHPPVAQSQAS